MIRIGLGLSVCDRCGSVVYQPTTTTTTTAAAPETTLYLTDTEIVYWESNLLTKQHEALTYVSASGAVNYYGLVNVPITSATWGNWGGIFNLKISGVKCSNINIQLIRVDSVNGNYIAAGNIIVAGDIGVIPVTIPSIDWDTPINVQQPSDDDIILVSISIGDGDTDDFTLDCTNATDTYLTLDAELDPQPWPATTTTTTT